MNKKLVYLVLGIVVLFVSYSMVASQSTAIIEIIPNDQGTLIAHWVATPTERIITTTPSASQTPWIVTATSIIPPTDTVEPTPTPEDTPPPPTFTVTPGPSKECSLRAAPYNLRIRRGPTTDIDNTVGFWLVGTERTFTRFGYDLNFNYLWGYSTTNPQGWSAVYSMNAAEWYVAGTNDAIFCKVVEGWPPGLEPPQPFANNLIIGLHVTNGNRSELTTFQTTLDYLSGTANYVQMNYCLDSINSGNVCRMRWPDDCPQNIGVDDPVASANTYMALRNNAVQNLKALVGVNVDRLIIELTNECLWEPYSWWTVWMNTALDYADAQAWPPLAIPGLGPGYGNYVMFEAWQEPLMRNHERGGYLSAHNYAPTQYCGGDGSLSNGNDLCAFRHRLNYRIITEELGYDVRILITEASPTDGYQPVTMETIRDIGRYTCMVENDPGLSGIYYWNVGDFAPFADANLGPWLVPLANSINTCGEF